MLLDSNVKADCVELILVLIKKIEININQFPVDENYELILIKLYLLQEHYFRYLENILEKEMILLLMLTVRSMLELYAQLNYLMKGDSIEKKRKLACFCEFYKERDKNSEQFVKKRIYYWFQLYDKKQKHIYPLVKEALIEIHPKFPLNLYGILSKYVHSDYEMVDFLIKDEGNDIFLNQEPRTYCEYIYTATLLMRQTLCILAREGLKFTFSQSSGKNIDK